MWMTRVKIVAVLVLGVGLLAGGAGQPAEPNAPAFQRAKKLMQKGAVPKIEGVPDPIAKDTDPVYGLKRFQRLLDDALADKKTDEQIIDTVFVAVLARLPRAGETKRLTDYLAKQKAAKVERKTIFAGVLSALVDSPEFVQHVQGLNKNDDHKKLLELFQKVPRLPKGDPNAPGRGPFFDQ